MSRPPTRRPSTRHRQDTPAEKLREATRGVPLWTALPRAARGLPRTVVSGSTQKTRPVPGQVEPMNPEIVFHPTLETVQDPIDHPIHQEPHGRPIGEKEMRAMRMAQALDLRVAGLNYREIGERLGVGVRTAYYDVQSALSYLARYQMVKAEELRMQETARLDYIQSCLWTQVQRGDVFAAQTVLRVIDMRAKLWGLYQTEAGMAGTAEGIAAQRPLAGMSVEEMKERRQKLLLRAAEEATSAHTPDTDTE